MPRHSARIDGNQPDIVDFIRQCGGTFQHTHQIPGALDGIVGYMGVDQRIEIKDPRQPKNKRALTELERKVFDTWKGRKPIIIETPDDILNLFNLIARSKR